MALKKISFFHRIFVIMSMSTILIVFAFEYILYESINSVRVESMESLALTQARLIASNRDLQKATKAHDGNRLGDLMSNYHTPPNIDYVSISDTSMIRLYHSVGRGIGKKLIDADLESIKAGNFVTIIGEGIENKLLIKARVPIFYEGKFVGIVSVGLNYDKVVSKVSRRFAISLLLALGIFAVLIFFNQSFTGYIRNKMHNQSPREIEMALKLRQGILNSVFEGVIAVDSDNRILVINDSALRDLHIVGGREVVHGALVADHLYPTDFFDSSNDEEVTDQIITCNGETLLANRRFMLDDKGNKTGAVVSFRIRTEKEELEHTINAVIQDKENLRAIIHEFNNQMSVIYGLLQMKHYEKAMDFIQSEHNSKQSDIYMVSKAFQIPTLVALVLSKISRAKELGVTLEIDPMSNIIREELPVSENKLTCIVGNLINNAFEAIIRSEPDRKVVRLYIQQGRELIIEVEDSGPGIPQDEMDKIFVRGYTRKSEENHGVGLNLVHNIVTQAQGTVIVEDSELGGALFNIYIPYRSEEETLDQIQNGQD